MVASMPKWPMTPQRSPRPSTLRSRRGVTLVEILIVVGILGILLSLTSFLRAPSATVFARDAQSLYQQARLEAVKRNRPVAVIWDADAGRLEARVDSGSTTVAAACVGDTLVRSLAPDEYGRLTITADFEHDGAVWLPSTLMRGCAGAATELQTLTVADARRTVDVEVSTTGEVNLR
jgi:prepilin-type N-terminal cleavage/methylation domain-containing protein